MNNCSQRFFPDLRPGARVSGRGVGTLADRDDRVRDLRAGDRVADDALELAAEQAVGEREREGIRRKPWPDMLDAARERMGLARGNCLYVGDSEVDILTAANAGLRCVSVSWGFRSREELLAAGAETLIDTPDALAELVLGL